MTSRHFQVAAIVLIVFNVVGTALSWTAHLSKPGTSNLHAVVNGTEFTGPIVFIAAWIVLVAMTWGRGRIATIGTVLMTVFAVLFSAGEISELFKSNIGVSTGKWDVILAATVAGLVIGATTVGLGAAVLMARLRRNTSEPAHSV